MAISVQASSAARQPWREAELESSWRNKPQQSCCSNTRLPAKGPILSLCPPAQIG